MDRISQKIVNSPVFNDIIPAEEKELYAYGFRQGFTLLANLLTTMIIGLFFSMVIESLIFIAAYFVLRPYAGGFHAKTPIRCYFISIIIIAAALSVIRLPFWNALIAAAMTIISAGIILWLAPVEDSNKPLDQTEKAVYKKRAYIILSILVMLALLAWFVGLSFVSVGIIAALFVLAVMLVPGKVKNILKEIRNYDETF